MFKKLLLASLVAGMSTQVIANEELYNQPQIGFTAGLTWGGDEIEVPFEDGTSQTLSFGGLFAFGAAARTQHSDVVSSKFTANYHFDQVSASNGELTFSRLTFDALAGFKANDDVTIYGGVTYHMSPELEVSEDGSGSLSGEYDSALGFVIEGAYNLDSNAELSLRLVNIEYEGDDLLTQSGNHLGIYYTGFFN